MKNQIPKANRFDCGVYSIFNTVNNKYYIGSAYCLQNRFYTHLSALRKGTHANKHLQRSFTKHGPSAFEFRLLVLSTPLDVKILEQQWLNDGFGNRCYNINQLVTPTGLNVRHVREVKLCSPDGEVVTFNGTQKDVAECIFNSLSSPPSLKSCQTSLNRLLSGKIKHIQGWRLPENSNFDWKAPRVVNYHTKTTDVRLRAPDGTIHGPITNVAEFCRNYNISNESTIRNLIAGRTQYVNGWSLESTNVKAKNSKDYNVDLVDPQGIVYTLKSNLSAFARAHGLEKSGLQQLVWGKLQSHRGWRINQA